MKNLIIYLSVIAILAGALIWLGFRDAPTPKIDPADKIITNGRIYTGIDTAPRAQAIAIRDNRIIYVGDFDGSQALNGDETETIDLMGHALYPGFVDGHAHLLGIGLREMTLNLDKTVSLAEVKSILAEVAAETPRGETIYGRGWIETHWPEDRFPNRYDLDEIVPNNPVILERADGHAVIVNSLALELSKIDAGTPSPFGGEILKDPSGQPTGMLIDKAADLVSSLRGEMTVAKKRAAYIKAAEVYASRGWTGIHNMSVDPADVALMEDLAASGDIGIRVYNSLNESGALDFISSHKPASDSLITSRAIKLYADGALGSRGAALLEPYDDAPGSVGLVTLKKDETFELLKAALESGIQINTHAIGDRGNRLVLDWYEDIFAETPNENRAIIEPRWRIEHAQVVSLDDLSRFDDLGVIPSMQPSHAIGDLHFAVDRIGVERLEGAYAWQSLIDDGVKIIGGSDAPVEQGDLRIEYYAAIARKDLSGFSAEGWYPEQAVSRTDALKMFTAWPAYGAFQENQLGEIAIGKKADFTVLSTDIMKADPQDILEADIVMTVVDGKILYDNRFKPDQ